MKKIAAITSISLIFFFLLIVIVAGSAQTVLASGAVTAVSQDWFAMLEQAKAEVIEEKAISNNLDTYAVGVLLKIMGLRVPGLLELESMSGLQDALEQYFIREETVEVEDDNGPEDEQVEDEYTGGTTTETIYRFASLEKLLEQLQDSPFDLSSEIIAELRKLFYLDMDTGNIGGGSGGQFTGSYPLPLQGRLTSDYGWRTHPVTGNRDFHTGIDLSGFWHDDVRAVSDGVVYQVSNDGFYGNFILIQHDDGLYSFYAHLSQQLVGVGQRIWQGQVIGVEGGQPSLDPNVGLSTGHHLHFGIYTSPSRSSHVDPKQYLSKD